MLQAKTGSSYSNRASLSRTRLADLALSRSVSFHPETLPVLPNVCVSVVTEANRQVAGVRLTHMPTVARLAEDVRWTRPGVLLGYAPYDY